MTLINLFRRYERWNPVHPTYGAFWGIGVGFGCGIGWGPGFGPEVVGYVGSGCGVGIGVGVTMLGIGVGLPAGGFTSIPCDVVSYASHRFFSFAAPLVLRTVNDGWQAASFSALDVGTKCKIVGSRELEKISHVTVEAAKRGWDFVNEVNGKIRDSGVAHFSGPNLSKTSSSLSSESSMKKRS